MDRPTITSNTTRKTIVFRVVLALIPFILLGLFEGGLRIGGYGSSFPIVVTKTLAGREYYVLNPKLALKYFTSNEAMIPEPSDDPFTIVKGPRTKRIFMLGESTMAGFPYDYNATAPSLLRDRLTLMFPGDSIEVINAGLAAINSYVVRDMIRELSAYQPDAFVVYLGHNEFYGPFGTGSSQYFGKSRTAVNLFIALKEFRTFQLVERMVRAIRGGTEHPKTAGSNPTLMAAMIGKNAIPFGSDDYAAALSTFDKNYRDIIETAKSHSIPIVISTMASNIADQKPLTACFSPSTPPDRRNAWKQAFDGGNAALQTSDTVSATRAFQAAVAIDSANADGRYALGRVLLAQSRYDEAKHQLTAARDYDGMRFRASSDWNTEIRSLAATEHVPLADAEKDFENASDHGIVGRRYMLEHLHPNEEGYFLLAKSFYAAIVSNGVAGFGVAGPAASDERMKIYSGVTLFDLEAGAYKIYGLTHRWPFVNTAEAPKMPEPANPIQDFAFRYAGGKMAWSDAKFALAKAYKDAHRYDEAVRELYSISKVAWYSYYPLMEMGDVARSMSLADSAEAFYRRGLSRQDTPFLHVRLGMLYYDQSRLPEAIREFEDTFISDQVTKDGMDKNALSMARYLLAVTYGKSGDIGKAKLNLQLAVQLNPRNQEAAAMLSKLN